jgi:thiaminase (transcriptional activator TenA)
MRSKARATPDAVISHRFFREIGEDMIEDRVFTRYLRIEYGFVDCAASALGYAVVKAASFRERRHLALGLYGLVTDQERFFVDAFERVGARPDQRTGLPP